MSALLAGSKVSDKKPYRALLRRGKGEMWRLAHRFSHYVDDASAHCLLICGLNWRPIHVLSDFPGIEFMPYFASRPAAPPPAQPDNAPAWSKGWQRAKWLVSGIAAFSTKATATLAAALAALVLSVLVFEQAKFWVNDARWMKKDHVVETAKREFLCNKHAFDPPVITVPEGLSDAGIKQLERKQALDRLIAEIYKLKETAKNHAKPFDTLGRVVHYLQCVTVSSASSTNVTLTSVERVIAPIGAPDASVDGLNAQGAVGTFLEWERTHYDFAVEHFAKRIPPHVFGRGTGGWRCCQIYCRRQLLWKQRAKKLPILVSQQLYQTQPPRCWGLQT